MLNQYIQISKGQRFADRNNVKYNPSTNTVDCLNKVVVFQNQDFVDGTFNFKLINLSNNCSNMFSRFTSLTHLPEDFKIPDSVNYCSGMFSNCRSLTHLPGDFILPNNVTECSFMFSDCTSLKELPDNFTIPIDSYYDDIFARTKFEHKEDQYITIEL